MRVVKSDRVAGDDVEQAFCDIHNQPEDLRKQMFETAQYMHPREGARDWAKSLRLLIQYQTEETQTRRSDLLEKVHQSN